ncbi:MAG: TonB-dependent receptor plug domain-containing protein [Polaribacter sp.]|nr:TonB-dependent receptor plug domain-containing protein [Polaribacter sp.]MDG1810771.1 TonB-dependent receptor plug domain-containing protein [Polaribacter sp.]MDG1993669.1 TonB-dependent receptor plug domain-containing protein [Polaribacter sp.]
MQKSSHLFLTFFFLLIASLTNKSLSAQEKKNYLLQRFEGVKELITKKSTVKELNEMKYNLERQGVFFSFTNLKYNANKEVISISIKLKNKKSEFSGEWNQKELSIPNIKIVEVDGIITVIKSKNTEFSLTEADNKKINFKSKNDKKPIYIVDGKITTTEDFKNIETENIESISVLKGNSAIDKYGEKGKNGVIEIKMKVR